MQSLRYPLRLSGTGRADVTTDEAQVWQDRVAVLLATMTGERAHEPDYGTRLAEAAFESSEDIERLVDDAVTDAFLKYLPTLSLGEIELGEDSNGRYILKVSFRLPDSIDEIEVETEIDASLFGE